jgi:hypothetical protein
LPASRDGPSPPPPLHRGRQCRARKSPPEQAGSNPAASCGRAPAPRPPSARARSGGSPRPAAPAASPCVLGDALGHGTCSAPRAGDQCRVTLRRVLRAYGGYNRVETASPVAMARSHLKLRGIGSPASLLPVCRARVAAAAAGAVDEAPGSTADVWRIYAMDFRPWLTTHAQTRGCTKPRPSLLQTRRRPSEQRLRRSVFTPHGPGISSVANTNTSLHAHKVR